MARATPLPYTRIFSTLSNHSYLSNNIQRETCYNHIVYVSIIESNIPLLVHPRLLELTQLFYHIWIYAKSIPKYVNSWLKPPLYLVFLDSSQFQSISNSRLFVIIPTSSSSILVWRNKYRKSPSKLLLGIWFHSTLLDLIWNYLLQIWSYLDLIWY